MYLNCKVDPIRPISADLSMRVQGAFLPLKKVGNQLEALSSQRRTDRNKDGRLGLMLQE